MSDFRITDRRGQNRPGSDMQATPGSGLLVPPGSALAGGGSTYRSDPTYLEMRQNRRLAMRKHGSAPITGGGAGGWGGGSGDMSFAIGRPRDPMFYWRQNNLPFDISKDEEMAKLREFCRLLYLTHPLLASCIDIYAKYPLQGMKIVCKDKQLEEFYDNLFMDQLNYRDYLVAMSREKWMVGEAFPLGTFNETLGVWEAEELLHPNDVTVETSPISRDPRFLIKLPEALRDVLRTRTPVWEYNQIAESYPELVAYAGENSRMPVSSMLLKHIKFEADTFHKRGIPIIMRAFRSVLQEEMLNTAQDAIADRLYTPLILAKIGASASDLGTQSPWIPTRDDLDAFRESLDEALAADFRVMVDNFTTQIENVFGKEEMPDLSEDFDRLEARMLMAFGLSQTMLTGADAGETFAADALNRDVVTQLMTDHQRQLKKFFHDRAAIVAEAQEHWDYDVRNGRRYVKMEEVLVVDEETGEEKIIEQPKLLVPELEFDTLNLSDQMQERQFIEGLVATGVPVPMRRRILGTGLDFDDMTEEKSEEQVALAVAEQETRRKSYEALRDGGLPIPDDLKQDFQPKPLQVQQQAEDAALPTLGTQDPPIPALAPTPEDEEEDPAEDAVGQLPQDGAVPGDVYGDPAEEGDQRPPESDEQRATMPKAAKIRPYRYEPKQIRKAALQHYEGPDNRIEDVRDEDGELIEARPENYRPSGRYGDVRIVGMRKHVKIAASEKWKRDWDEEAV